MDSIEKKSQLVKRHGWRIFVIIVMTLLAMGSGWLFADAKTARKNESIAVERITALSEQLAESLADDTDTEDVVSAKTDKEHVTEVVTAYAHAYKAWEKSSVAVDTANINDSSVAALVSFTTTEPDGGMGCIVKKIPADNTWVVISCGQGLPDQVVLDNFGIPSNVAQTNGVN